jgi:hypothetical protein
MAAIALSAVRMRRVDNGQISSALETILSPPKRFDGPVGQFANFQHEFSLVQLQEDGLWPLMVEALDRHHFYSGNHEPFTCPPSTCTVSFLKAGEWTVHAAESHYQE